MDIAQYLSDLETIMDMESPSAEPECIKVVSDWFVGQFLALGWHTRQICVDQKAGPVLIATNGESSHYDIAFFAHIDTVFPVGTTKKWRFLICGNEVHGPGACDMKQGALAMLYIAREMYPALCQRLSVAMVFTPDEEIGSPYSAAFQREFARHCDAIVIMEAGWTDGARCISRNGKLSAEVRFHGIPAHAGYIFSAKSASALLEAAHWAEELMAMRNKERALTVNIGRIEGGTADNIVAEDAMISFEARYTEQTDHDAIKAKIDSMLLSPYVEGVTATVEKRYDCPAMQQGKRADRLTDQLRRAYKKSGRSVIFRHRAGLSDGNIMAEYAPVLDSMGPCGQYGHCDREYMLMDTVAPTIDMCVGLLEEIATDKG